MTNMTAARDSVPATTHLQMIRAEIKVREFHRWMGSRRLQDPDHAIHCLLTECFGKPPPAGDGLAPKPLPPNYAPGRCRWYALRLRVGRCRCLAGGGPTIRRPGAMSNSEPSCPGCQVDAHGMDGGQAFGF